MRVHISLLFFLSSFSFSFAQNDTNYSYSAIQFKGYATVETEEQFHRCQYNFVNVIDSFMYVQIFVAGIEVGRVFATPNNILFINKLQKQFFFGDYSVLLQVFEFETDFNTLQKVLNRVSTNVPEEVQISYLDNEEFLFFKTLFCNFRNTELKIEVRKVWFEEVPEVSTLIPKKFRPMTIKV